MAGILLATRCLAGTPPLVVGTLPEASQVENLVEVAVVCRIQIPVDDPVVHLAASLASHRILVPVRVGFLVAVQRSCPVVIRAAAVRRSAAGSRPAAAGILFGPAARLAEDPVAEIHPVVVRVVLPEEVLGILRLVADHPVGERIPVRPCTAAAC